MATEPEGELRGEAGARRVSRWVEEMDEGWSQSYDLLDEYLPKLI